MFPISQIGLAFHQGPTFINNAYYQAAENLVDRDSGLTKQNPPF